MGRNYAPGRPGSSVVDLPGSGLPSLNQPAAGFRGRVSIFQGKIEEALHHFTKVGAPSPDAYDVQRYMAGCYRNLGDHSRSRNASVDAIEATRKRLKQQPDDSRAWTYGAMALAELGEPEKSKEWIQQALAIDPDEPIIVYNAACTYIGSAASTKRSPGLRD